MIGYNTATRDDVQRALKWAAAEGWNPGDTDAVAFMAADPAGFFVARDGDRPVAAISVVNHTDDFAFLGLYIVTPAHRGRGIGYGLWQHAIAHAGERTIGLDGVPDQQANYAASGFVAAGATTRYAGAVTPLPHSDIRLARPDDIAPLIDLEARASGVRKPAYLKAWLTHDRARQTLVAQTANAPSGFCTLRKCVAGTKIGPLVADNVDTANRLITHAASLFGPDLVIDVPATSHALADLCQRHGLTPGFATTRMYRGPFAPAKPAIYAVTSLELG